MTDTNQGRVVSVRGSVVDIRFDAELPSIYSLLHAMEGNIAIEVLAQLDAQHVRGIALTPTQGLARGMTVEDSGGPLKAHLASDGNIKNTPLFADNTIKVRSINKGKSVMEKNDVRGDNKAVQPTLFINPLMRH